MLSLAASAPAATFTHYGPPNAAAWSLYGRSVSGGAGTLPGEYPSPQPWSLAAGDYCTAYKFSQPSAPTKSAPFLTVSDVDLVNVTGFDPGVPREQYQLRHNAQFDSSACQAKGATWGFWTNANTANNYCPYRCGVRHDFSTGMALSTRPWANGYGAGAKSKNLNLCSGLFTGIKCYSTDPDKYALLGIEDGLELLGSGAAQMGGYSSGLLVYTDY